MTTSYAGHADDHHHHGPDPGPAPMGVHHQPQGHRDAVPVVRAHHVLRRRVPRHGDPGRAVPARLAGDGSAPVQPVHHDACADHDLRRDHARVRRLCELARPNDGRRTRHGAAAAEQLELLDTAVRVHPPDRQHSSCRAGRRQRAGRSIRRSYCREGRTSRSWSSRFT